MKIAIASDDGIHVAGHAGRSEGFVVMEYDGHAVTQREYRTSPMPGHVHAGEHHPDAHGHHHAHADTVSGSQHMHRHGGDFSDAHAQKHARIRAALAGCDILICGGMGHRLQTDLHQAGITVRLTTLGNVEDAFQAWRDGRLEEQLQGFCRH
ncbi:MAG: NifB/NifX family molybdenum-iron cluster-binding protein [Bacteroidia bacterium]|nr:NifB/NifX family molybdenum-iron cluster-binding protein [Bacteroidia bacterium]